MRQILVSVFTISVGMSLVGCASVSFREGLVRDSALSNLNPAPESISPPKYSDNDANPMVDPVYMSSQADYHFTLGEAFSFEGKSQRAIEEFKLTQIYDPQSVVVRMRLAAEYVRVGMLTEAIEQAEIAVDMAPDNSDARMLLGGLHTSLKMYDLAIEQYREALRIDPLNGEAAIYIGAIMAEQKKFDQAVTHLRAVAKNPSFRDSERAYYYIGRIRIEQGEA